MAIVIYVTKTLQPHKYCAVGLGQTHIWSSVIYKIQELLACVLGLSPMTAWPPDI